ncbi:MAG: hypothetical protein QM727_15695 [Niabella sp.]
MSKTDTIIYDKMIIYFINTCTNIHFTCDAPFNGCATISNHYAFTLKSS